MKNVFISLFVFSQCAVGAQEGNVGINQPLPEANLDVNGNVIIRHVDEIKDFSKAFKMLLLDEKGEIFYVNKDLVINSGKQTVEKRAYGVLNKGTSFALKGKGNEYVVDFNGDFNGINIKDITLSTDKKYISFPPNKAFKVTGSIGVRGGDVSGQGKNNPGYIIGEFYASSGNPVNVIFSTKGFTESSSERFDDGGMSAPVIVFTTGNKPGSIYFKAKYGRLNSPGTFYLAGSPSESSLGSYLTIEEL